MDEKSLLSEAIPVQAYKVNKEHERTLSVIDNSVNSTVMGMLTPLLKTHSSSSILEPAATKSRSHSCHATA